MGSWVQVRNWHIKTTLTIKHVNAAIQSIAHRFRSVRKFLRDTGRAEKRKLEGRERPPFAEPRKAKGVAGAQ